MAKKTIDQRRAEVAAAMNGQAEDSAVVERKNRYRDKYKAIREPIELVKEMDRVRGIKDALDEKLKEVNAAYDVLRIEMVPTLFDDLGLENLRVADLGRVSLTADVFTSIKKEKKTDFFKWLKKRRQGDLIQPIINSSTLRAWVKEQYKKGVELPEGMLNVTPYTRASITKG